MVGKTHTAIFFLLLVMPLLALIVIAFLLIGETKWVLFLVLLVPLFLMLLLVYMRFSGISQRNQKLFEIERHLTETEREEYEKLSSYGLQDWVIIGLAELLLITLFLPFFNSVPEYLAPMVPFLFIIPYFWRRGKAAIRFLLSTEYAVSKGWKKL
jgi:hypothetical protein